jgi:hypothetical protein
MDKIDLNHGTVFVLNPICFPSLAGKGREEIPNFFDVIRFAWIQGDRETLKKATGDLEEKILKIKKTKREELAEMKALSALLWAGISNETRDWEKAYGLFYDLIAIFKNTCECEHKCFYMKKAIEATMEIKEFCLNCATF